MQKLYKVSISFDTVMYVESFPSNEDIVSQLAEMAVGDDLYVNFREIDSEEDLPHSWDSACIPYFGDDYSTIGDILEKQTKSNAKSAD